MFIGTNELRGSIVASCFDLQPRNSGWRGIRGDQSAALTTISPREKSTSSHRDRTRLYKPDPKHKSSTVDDGMVEHERASWFTLSESFRIISKRPMG